MPETLLQRVERLNREIKFLNDAKFNILSCQDTNHKVLEAIDEDVTEKMSWVTQNYTKAIHAMIFQLLHSFRDMPIISTDHNEKIILKWLIANDFVEIKRVKTEEGKLTNGYSLAQKFDELPSVEEIYNNVYLTKE